VARTATQLTLVTLPATLQAQLRERDLPRLRAAGPLAKLLADQSEAHAEVHGMSQLATQHAALPDDLVNFHHDPVTCAVAVGWPGAVFEELALATVLDDGVLRWEPCAAGTPTRAVTSINGENFNETWLSAVARAER
jgi:inosine-uridine nucleoside N-ribohydrolase